MSLARTGRHTEKPEGWWKSRPRWQKITALVVGLLAIAGTAAALLLASIGTSSNTFTFNVAPESSVTIDAIGSFDDCAGGVSNTSTSFSIDTWSNFGPGSVCRVNLTLLADYGNLAAGTTIYVSDVTVSDGLVEAVIWDNTDTQCGPLNAIALPDDGTTVTAKVVYTVTDPGVAGSYSWSLASGDEMKFTDSDQGDCQSF